MKWFFIVPALICVASWQIATSEEPPQKKECWFRVTIYSANGQEIKSWQSQRVDYRNGMAYFTDKHKKQVVLNGTFVIEEINGKDAEPTAKFWP